MSDHCERCEWREWEKTVWGFFFLALFIGAVVVAIARTAPTNAADNCPVGQHPVAAQGRGVYSVQTVCVRNKP